MIESFQELAAYASARGVQLAVQNHNNGSFVMNTGQVLRILREVDRENFTFLLDTGQWQGAIGSHPRGEWDSSVDLYEDYLKPTAPHATYVRAKIYKIDSGREEVSCAGGAPSARNDRPGVRLRRMKWSSIVWD